ncbi:MAG TPA: aryl-sulfate sulfohydrolase [Fuerstia sp.]|nr:aryl-sulfate sulfohydrolase [Fuerstiella sp.]
MVRQIIIALHICGLLVAGSASAAEKPNVVFFFIDDLGWADLAYQGSDFYESPNIDKLAASGMVFTDAYACAPNCAPSRACLLSGKYTPRHGIYTVGDPKRGNHQFRKLEPAENKTVLDDEFVTWAEVLDSNGYALASMGKWHLGSDPTTQGFDVNIAGKEWGSPSGGGYHSPYKYPNLVQKQKGEYLTDRLTDEAVKFIDDNKDQPFFLYLTHYAVHTPIQAKADITAKYQAKTPGQHQKNAKYAAMIESVDDSVGRVLAKVEELGLTDNTVIVFYSDNGGHIGATSNHPLRGAKGMLYEGGIREPFIVRWPGVTKAGSRCSEPIIGVDLYPTFAEITDSKLTDGYELDGLSIVPLLQDSAASLDRDALFWHFPCFLQGSGDPHGGPFRTTPAGAIRMGDWKLIEWFESGRLELYNLSDDLSEANDLSKSNPDKLAQLHSAMKQWRTDVSAPVPTTPNPKYDPDAKQGGGRRKKQ